MHVVKAVGLGMVVIKVIDPVPISALRLHI